MNAFVPGLATWGKRVGRKWEQLKKNESTDGGNNINKRRDQSQNKNQLPPNSSKSRRVSRVESLRHMFVRTNNSEPKVDHNLNAEPLSSKNGSEWVKKECQKGLSDLYQLNNLILKGKSKKADKKSKDGTMRYKTKPIETVAENPFEDNAHPRSKSSGKLDLIRKISGSEPTVKSMSQNDLLKNIQDNNSQNHTSKSSCPSLNQFPATQPSLTDVPKLMSTSLDERTSNGLVNKNVPRRTVVNPPFGRRSLPPDPPGVTVNLRTQPHIKEIYNFLNNFIMMKSEESGYESDSVRHAGDQNGMSSPQLQSAKSISSQGLASNSSSFPPTNQLDFNPTTGPATKQRPAKDERDYVAPPPRRSLPVFKGTEVKPPEVPKQLFRDKRYEVSPFFTSILTM